MNVAVISVDKKVATEKYKEYLVASKKHKSREYSAARRAYRALSKGLKVIDIYAAFEKTQVKPDGSGPKLAIVRADAKEVHFIKEENGAGRFQRTEPHSWGNQPIADRVNLPAGTFPEWETEIVGASATSRGWTRVKDPELVTNVPFIPAHIFVPGALENYYILFEVDKWKKNVKVKDPYLLQRLNDNTFVVLAEWDVTDVEASIMRAR